MRIDLPELLWYGRGTVSLDLPDGWDVEVSRMRGAKLPAMPVEKMASAINDPIGTSRLSTLARDKKKAVIVFDDMTRPTPTHQIAPLVIEELLRGGMDEENISLVCALGTHGALTQNDLRKKVGSEILRRFRVYNHNCYENCVEIGTTSRGTRLAINREVASADLKIGIGCVTAHANVGYSGGGKIILPGVAHMDSIAHYHMEVPGAAPETVGLGNYDQNVMRFNIEEAATMAGLDFKVDALFNEYGETTHLFAGAFLPAHARAVEESRKHYSLHPTPHKKDLMISNAFAKPNEMAIAAYLAALGLPDFNGTGVVIANAPEGQVVHYLLGRFGKEYGGRLYPVAKLMDNFKLIVQAPFLDKTFGDWFANPETITWTRDWTETRKLLEASFGPGTRVGVIPSGTMAYYNGTISA